MEGAAGGGGEGRQSMSSGRQGSRSPQELLSRGKNGFFGSHKVCIVAQRGALMRSGGPHGGDNLGSVPQTPYAYHLPEGHKQSPAAKPRPSRLSTRLRYYWQTRQVQAPGAPGARRRAGPWGTKGAHSTRAAIWVPSAQGGPRRRERRADLRLERARER